MRNCAEEVSRTLIFRWFDISTLTIWGDNSYCTAAVSAQCFEHTRSLLTKFVSPHVGDHWLRLQSHVRDLRTHLLTCVYWLNVCCCTMICQMHGRGEKQISVTISSQKVHAEDTSWTHRVTFVKLSQPHYNIQIVDNTNQMQPVWLFPSTCNSSKEAHPELCKHTWSPVSI